MKDDTSMRNQHMQLQSGPYSSQLEKACGEQQRPTMAKNEQIIFFKKTLKSYTLFYI